MKFNAIAHAARFALSLAAIAAASSASATVLSSTISMDNGFVAYISTSDNAVGTMFSSGNDWPTSITGSTTLAAGTDYYLHIHGYDQGWVAGFLGSFSLSGSDHSFSNSLTTLLTDATNWKANRTGFSDPYTAVSTWGTNSVGPWGTRGGIDASATWIWSGDNDTNDNAYFSTKISANHAVPEPTSIGLLGIALAGLGLAQARKRKTLG